MKLEWERDGALAELDERARRARTQMIAGNRVHTCLNLGVGKVEKVDHVIEPVAGETFRPHQPSRAIRLLQQDSPVTKRGRRGQSRQACAANYEIRLLIRRHSTRA
jgi:hypothetical protein